MPSGEIDWSDWSEDHVARHGITSHEVEEAFRSTPFTQRGRDGTYSVVGKTVGVDI